MGSREPIKVEPYGYEFQYDERPGDGSGEIVENVGQPGETAVADFFHDNSGATGDPPGVYVRTSERDAWVWTADCNAAAAYVYGFMAGLVRGIYPEHGTADHPGVEDL